MKDTKANLKRLSRLVQIRDTYVSVAETSVKQAEGEVRRLTTADEQTAGNIKHTQAEIAYLQTASGQDVHNSERYIRALKQQRKLIQQSLEKARGNLERRHMEWTEAMREQKIAEKLQERRLHQLEREDDTARQKSQDDVSIGRYVRTRFEK